MPLRKINPTPIRIGTRGSKLALWQATWVSKELKKNWSSLSISLVPIKTTGDKITDVSLAKIGGKGLFIKEIEDALINRKIDLAVHSIKDVPAELPAGLVIKAIPYREDPRDVLISHEGIPFEKLKSGARIGTSSLRRVCQLKKLRGDLVYEELRGNVDTRIKKLRSGKYDAIVLAAAGLVRLGRKGEITQYLDTIPAVGQGAMGIEIRSGEKEIEKLLKPLNDEKSQFCVEVERAFLKVIGSGCQVPLGCHAHHENDKIKIEAFVSSLDGKEFIHRSCSSDEKNAIKEAQKIAHEILQAGGERILQHLIST